MKYHFDNHKTYKYEQEPVPEKMRENYDLYN